jgi:hypothetical protein
MNNHELFPLNIKSKEELRKCYQAFGTMLRTSDSQAIKEKMAQDDMLTLSTGGSH